MLYSDYWHKLGILSTMCYSVVTLELSVFTTILVRDFAI